MLSISTLSEKVAMPVILSPPPIVTSFGRPILIWLFVTVVSISFVVPANVIVEPVLTSSVVPLSAAMSNVLVTSAHSKTPEPLVFKK